MKRIFTIFVAMSLILSTSSAKTLVVYYSYTGNCESIVTELTNRISADVVEIEPAEKGLRYEANNYALGTQLLNAIKANPNDAASYPAIDPVSVSAADYSTVIIVTPLWWSQMAAIMQSYLFQVGAQLSGKQVGLIVSSASSSISGVVADCHRLVSDADYLPENLWINNSNRSNLSQRKLFGIYESTYCYQNKPDHWSDAQTLHRQKMGAASLYAKLLLQDPDFAAQATAYRLSLNRRANNPHSAADKHLRPYLRNQQMLTSLIYSRLSADTSESFTAPLLSGYARYTSARFLDRPAILTQLASEDIFTTLKSTFLNDFC